MPRVLFGRVPSESLLPRSSPHMFLSFIPVFSPGHSLNPGLHTHLLPCHKYQLTFPHRRWIARVGKAEALANAGVMLPPSGSDDVKEVPEAIQKSRGAVKVVAFNVVSIVPLNSVLRAGRPRVVG